MDSNTIWHITFSMNNEGRKQLETIAKKLNTTPSELVSSIIDHGINSMYDCLNSNDVLKYKRAVFQAKVEELEDKVNSEEETSQKGDKENEERTTVSASSEIPGLEDFKF